MKSKLIIAGLLLIVLPFGADAKITRIEISPSVLMNLAQGHSGALMGGAITGDVFWNRSFAIRTTVGFTKDRYYPSELDYAQSDYGFWLSFAPYGQLNLGKTASPYMAFLGTFSSGGGSYAPQNQMFAFETAPVTQIRAAGGSAASFSLGLTLGTKVRLMGDVKAFAEVSHYLYSSLSRPDSRVYFGYDGADGPPIARFFDLEHNPTYFSFGLTYGFTLGKGR
jgi:hypothetical protein